MRYEIVDAHLHYLDFVQNSDGFPALCDAMDLSGVSKAVVFGMGITKQEMTTQRSHPANTSRMTAVATTTRLPTSS